MYQEVHFNRTALNAIKEYFKENNQAEKMTFTQKESRMALKTWRECVWQML